MRTKNSEEKKLVVRRFVEECVVFEENKSHVPLGKCRLKEYKPKLDEAYSYLLAAMKVYLIAALQPDSLGDSRSIRGYLNYACSLMIRSRLGQKKYRELFTDSNNDSITNHLYLNEVGLFYYRQYATLLSNGNSVDDQSLIEYGKQGRFKGMYSGMGLSWSEYADGYLGLPDSLDDWEEETDNSLGSNLKDGIVEDGEDESRYIIIPIKEDYIRERLETEISLIQSNMKDIDEHLSALLYASLKAVNISSKDDVVSINSDFLLKQKELSTLFADSCKVLAEINDVLGNGSLVIQN